MEPIAQLRYNYSKIHERVHSACQKYGRRPEDVTIIWVSKTQPRQRVIEALRAGAADLGENKAQETLIKYPMEEGLGTSYRLHFIGHLQSNKIRKILPLCSHIHSVDSLPLLGKLDNACLSLGLKRDIFLQVNISGEDTKSGFEMSTFLKEIKDLPALTSIRIMGLMTIAPFTGRQKDARQCFKQCSRLLKQVKSLYSAPNHPLNQANFLSMGMSDDFEVAIEQGSHYIRIGTALFGHRNYGVQT
jgi:pyridoxal phosphate enzyme (YggS family)